jgi:AhpC/TSA family
LGSIILEISFEFFSGGYPLIINIKAYNRNKKGFMPKFFEKNTYSRDLAGRQETTTLTFSGFSIVTGINLFLLTRLMHIVNVMEDFTLFLD